MTRHELELFGLTDPDLAGIADVIYAEALHDQSIQDTNDGVRTGYHSTMGYGTPPRIRITSDGTRNSRHCPSHHRKG